MLTIRSMKRSDYAEAAWLKYGSRSPVTTIRLRSIRESTAPFTFCSAPRISIDIFRPIAEFLTHHFTFGELRPPDESRAGF